VVFGLWVNYLYKGVEKNLIARATPDTYYTLHFAFVYCDKTRFSKLRTMSRYNLRSRSNPTRSLRFEDEVFLPGSNNGHCAGREIDIGRDLIETQARDTYDLQAQPDVDEDYVLENVDLYDTSDEEAAQASESEEEEMDSDTETEEDEDDYSVYSEEEDEPTSDEDEAKVACDFCGEKDINPDDLDVTEVNLAEQGGGYAHEHCLSEHAPPAPLDFSNHIHDDEVEEGQTFATTPSSPYDDWAGSSWKGWSCNACIQGQPNQMAHMEPGGCLYDDLVDGYITPEPDSPPEHPPALVRQQAYIEPSPPADSYIIPGPPKLRRQTAVGLSSLDNMTNEQLLDEFFRPRFSVSLSNDPNAVIVPFGDRLNPCDGALLHDGEVSFIRVKAEPEIPMELHGLVLCWKGEMKYNTKSDRVNLRCWTFEQDIHPFIYDSWNHDDDGLVMDEIILPTCWGEWFLFDDDEKMSALVKASRWYPDQPFEDNILGYGEWEWERIDVQHTGKAPRQWTADDWDKDWEEESKPDSIS
jgi:hypothetical protein